MRVFRLTLLSTLLIPGLVDAAQIQKPLQMPRQNLRAAPVETAPLRMRPVEPLREEPFRMRPVEPLRESPLRSEPLRSEPLKSPVQSPLKQGMFQKPSKSCVQK